MNQYRLTPESTSSDGVNMDTHWLLGIDGDRIGRAIEAQLAADDILGCQRLSHSIDHALKLTTESVIQAGGTPIFASGDSLLARFDNSLTSDFVRGVLAHLLKDFQGSTGLSASGGASRSPHGVMLAMKLAKANGGSCYVIDSGLENKRFVIGTTVTGGATS